ncbi:phosphate/phosphite/phosphonate ABC transporter substrate-binding protein [Azospirillum thermophilum]|uniref:Phosphate ABC transporter substrate-binding protein n=1 Tax=Azospirillum thermophilum TaxID=2202148 RepID=A0A2S2D0C1_9PROT|nr:phosphate/phosphite/phosphonate ABC transporter substrate-binding protein [Azospirillum thermophilum]AWK89907.1 phosphate ABC transporter substrate-binding protein [Azospirillum thermophilum]
MLKRLILALPLLLGLLPAQASAADQPPFKIGIAPHTSARVIVEQYQPVRRAVEAAIGRPAEIVTAPDFTAFARRAIEQEYDVAVTTGHQAQLLRSDAGYLPLLTYKADFKAVVIAENLAGKGAKYPSAADLRGTTVLGLNPSSLVTLWGQHWLSDAKVPEVQIRYVSAADSVAQIILAGDASAGFISLANLQKLAPEVQARLTTIARSEPMAGRVYLMNGRNAALRGAVHDALLAFGATAEGRAYFDTNALGGYREITGGELAAMEPLADEVRAVLKSGAKTGN